MEGKSRRRRRGCRPLVLSFAIGWALSPCVVRAQAGDGSGDPSRPAPVLDFGYYRADRVPSGRESHLVRVREWTNLVYFDWYADARAHDYEAGDAMRGALRNMDGMMRRAVAADMVMVMDVSWGLGWGPLLTRGEILQTAAPYWDHVKYVLLGDELQIEVDEANALLASFRTAMTRLGLPERPIGVTLTPKYVLENPPVLGADWDYIAIEAFTPDCRCEDCGQKGARREIDAVAELIRAQEAMIPPEIDLMMIMQGYDRNGFFADIDTLAALNRATYFEMVKGNPRYRAIAVFNWDRPGTECASRPHPQHGHGSRGFPKLQEVHREIWRDLTTKR